MTDDLPTFLTVPETAKVLRIGTNLCYRQIAEGQIPHIRIGSAIRVPRERLLLWMRSGKDSPLLAYLMPYLPSLERLSDEASPELQELIDRLQHVIKDTLEGEEDD